jgi:hypothetical protein
MLDVFFAASSNVADIVETEPQHQIGQFHECLQILYVNLTFQILINPDGESACRNRILIASGNAQIQQMAHHCMRD